MPKIGIVALWTTIKTFCAGRFLGQKKYMYMCFRWPYLIAANHKLFLRVLPILHKSLQLESFNFSSENSVTAAHVFQTLSWLLTSSKWQSPSLSVTLQKFPCGLLDICDIGLTQYNWRDHLLQGSWWDLVAAASFVWIRAKTGKEASKNSFTYTVELQWLKHWRLVYHGCFGLVLESLGKNPWMQIWDNLVWFSFFIY